MATLSKRQLKKLFLSCLFLLFCFSSFTQLAPYHFDPSRCQSRQISIAKNTPGELKKLEQFYSIKNKAVELWTIDGVMIQDFAPEETTWQRIFIPKFSQAFFTIIYSIDESILLFIQPSKRTISITLYHSCAIHN